MRVSRKDIIANYQQVRKMSNCNSLKHIADVGKMVMQVKFTVCGGVRMEELALKLKKQYEKNHYQSLISTQCKCGKFAKIIMSNYVTNNTLYAIIYCKKCNKFFKHSGGSTLEVCGETSYNASEYPIEYGSKEWDNLVKKIEAGSIFA